MADCAEALKLHAAQHNLTVRPSLHGAEGLTKATLTPKRNQLKETKLKAEDSAPPFLKAQLQKTHWHAEAPKELSPELIGYGL